MAADPLTECPRCRGHIYRLISGGVGFIFKGSGFYITDSRKGKDKDKEAEKGKEAPEASKGKPESSEAK